MTVAVVVPCFDEAARFDVDAFVGLAAKVDRLLLVDDGSTDGTAALLDAVADRAGDRVRVLRLGRNGGKAEAVRAGLAAALDGGATIAGYFDADLATPVDELLRLIDVLHGDADPRRRARQPCRPARPRDRAPPDPPLPRPVVRNGSQPHARGPRVRHAVRRQGVPGHAGASRRRSPHRSPTAGRSTSSCSRACCTPPERSCRSRAEAIVEVPLRAWRDVAGSKVRPVASVRAALALFGVAPAHQAPLRRLISAGGASTMSVTPQRVTSSIDSTMIRPDIFDLPRSRSRNTIGVSTIR